MPTNKDYTACFSDLDVFIKLYPQEKLYAILNVNRKPFSEISIDDLGLGTRALNSLFRHDKTAIKDVLSLSVNELHRFRELGVKTIKEIITQLLFYFQEHPELVSPCNAEDDAKMQAEEETTFALEFRNQLAGAMHFIPEDVKERGVLPLLRAFEASAFGKIAPAIRVFIAEPCLQIKVCDFPQYVEQLEVGKQFADQVMAAGAFMDWLKDRTRCSVESAMQAFQKHLGKRSPKRWELLKLRADGVALDEAAKQLGIAKNKAAQTEHTALELFYSTYIREETDIVMMVYALKLGRPLLLTDELAAYIGKTASLLRFACRQGLHFPCFTYDERGDAFLILAEEWEHRAYEQSRDAIRYSLPFRSWLEEDGALAPDEIEQCITELLKAEGLAKSNNLEHHALFDCQQDEPLLTIIGLWTLDAFHDLDRECKGRYAKIYFPLLAKHYKESGKHATMAIFEEQGAAHNGRNHPYRQKLDMDFASRIGIYTKEQLLNGQLFDPVTVMEQVCICVLSYDSFRGRKENLKARQENSNLTRFVEVFGASENRVEDADESALLQVLNNLNPLVIIDESHHAKSKLSIQMLKDFNPCFVLELTATPKDGSNIIVYVDAVQLKKESMVKLPVVVYNRSEQAQVIADTIDMRNRLEELAVAAREKTGRYIRPIALFQAEPKGKEDNTTFERLREKLLRFGIPSQQIAIRTADVNELKNINLMSDDCPVRYIITVNALKEGWDCPFAYILASLANKTSQIDVEQILGRILRLPYTKDNPIPALNMSYVLTSSNDFSATLEKIVSGLNAAGFSAKDCRVETEIAPAPPAPEPAPVQEPLEEAPQEEPEEFLNFNDADIERVLKERQNEAAQESGRSAVDEMLAAAEQAGQDYADTMEQAGASDPNLSWEVKNKMQNFFIKPEFRDEIKALRLPQFVRTVPGNIFKQGFTTFLERESIAEVFTLKGKASDIDFSNADTQMVYVDVRDQSGVVPKVYKMSSAEQQAVKDFLAKASPQARITRCKKMLYDHLSKMKGIDEGEMRQYVNRIVDDMTDEQREGLEKSPAAYALKIKAKIEGLLEEHYEKTFNEWLETDLIQCQDLYAFPDFIHPAESDSMIGGSLYEAEEAMNGLERELALELTAIPSVRWWHRNIADKEGFRINGFINHYPDIIVMTQKGTVVLVETKGEHLKNDDSAQKARIGRAWQRTAGKKYRYYMVFRDTDSSIDGMISISSFIEILKNL